MQAANNAEQEGLHLGIISVCGMVLAACQVAVDVQWCLGIDHHQVRYMSATIDWECSVHICYRTIMSLIMYASAHSMGCFMHGTYKVDRMNGQNMPVFIHNNAHYVLWLSTHVTPAMPCMAPAMSSLKGIIMPVRLQAV